MINKKRAIISLFLLINLIAINGAIISLLNHEYPMVGHDYRLAIPHILDTVNHFYQNGLVTQWYTPSFGGGVPAFPNPNNIQFSLPVFLSLWFQPWNSIIISSIFFVSIGFLSSYRLFKSVLNLHWTAAILGAIFFSANGFMMQRIAVGHLGYQPFPLLALVILLIVDKSVPKNLAATSLALIFAGLIHQAGFFVVIAVCLSSSLVFPLLIVYSPKLINPNRIAFILIIGGILAFLLTLAKLSAIFAFMRFFPREVRDTYSSGIGLGLISIVLQLLGTMNLSSLAALAQLDLNLTGLMVKTSGTSFGYWEYDMSLTPLVFGLLILGFDKFLHNPGKYLNKIRTRERLPALAILLVMGWICIEFILGRGLLFPYLQSLPIIGSLHVNARFAVLLLLPLAILAMLVYQNICSPWPKNKKLIAFVIANLAAVLPLSTYILINDDLQARIYDISTSKIIYESLQKGDNLKVEQIGYVEDNTAALLQRTSNLNFYEPIFGYSLENFHPEISPGSVWSTSGGFYNMTNPVGYVFPEAGSNRLYERFKIQDKDVLLNFVNHTQPDWPFPLYQSMTNWVSLLTLISILVFLSYFLITSTINRFSVISDKSQNG